MIANEILVKYDGLSRAVSAMRSLQNGTGMANGTPGLFMLSKSETADEALAMYEALQETEKILLELIEKTISAMEVAGVSFEKADSQAGRGFDELPFMVIL